MVAGRTRTSRSALPRGSTDCNSHSVVTLARNALSTRETSFALSSARHYKANWTRFVAFGDSPPMVRCVIAGQWSGLRMSLHEWCVVCVFFS